MGARSAYPLGPLLSNFMQISGKNGKIIGWRSLLCLGLAHPSLGNPGSATDRVNFRQWYRRFYLYYNSVSYRPEQLKEEVKQEPKK